MFVIFYIIFEVCACKIHCELKLLFVSKEATKMAMAARQQQQVKKPKKDKIPKLPNRPNISITPVNPTTVITTNTTKYVNSPSTVGSSPGKTLQEKLAEKQKQLSTKHAQSEKRSPEKNVHHINTGISNVVLPTSLTISRTSAALPSFPLNSGMSISEVRLFILTFFSVKEIRLHLF